MKKRKTIIIIAIAAVLVVLLFPIRMNLKDGGSVSYQSLLNLYEVTKIHKLSHDVDGVKPYIDGLEIKILGMTVYRKTNDTQIVGGSDGPTSIIVSNENGDPVKKPIRMIKVDGKLYYDSGKVSENTPRCGTMDGELKQVGVQHEIPKNDNECNFEGAEGYQNATSTTKEVPIDGEWVIFKLFDDPELDMDVFKYCFYLKGAWFNAEHQTELVVLTENIDYTIQDFFDLSKSYVKPDYGKYRTTFKNYGDIDEWGISLSAKDITNKGLTILCEQFGGSPTGELQTGEAFSLEYSDNGEWKPVPTNPLIDYAWHQVASMVKKNDITEFEVDWGWLYGELKPGYYKLKKEFTDFRATGDFDNKMYELHFTVK